jgi:Uma2 family endonuclease
VSQLTTSLTDDDYPAEDGVPMAETQLHIRAIILFYQALEDVFADRPDVFVASDIFWYWKEGDVTARVAPDVLVAVGVEPKPVADRRSYLQWRERGITPSLVFETASRGTWRADLTKKKALYRRRGVAEYVVFDPQARYLRTRPLRGFALRGRKYEPMPEADGELVSALGIRLRSEGELLRVIDGRTGRPVLSRQEAAAEFQRQSAEFQRQSAEFQRQSAEFQRQRDAEQTRAAELAAEVQRLRALLGGNSP